MAISCSRFLLSCFHQLLLLFEPRLEIRNAQLTFFQAVVKQLRDLGLQIASRTSLLQVR